MRYSTSGMILAAMTIGEAMAGPAHAHRHRHLHEKKDLSDVDWNALNWDDMGIDWASAYAAGQHTSTSAAAAPTVAPVAPAATSAPPTPPATHPSSAAADAGGIFNEVATLYNGLVGIANSFTSFGTPTASSGSEVGAIGNIGNKQGSNMLKVDSVEGNDFTINFINTSGASMTVVIWNKAYSPTGNAADADPNLGSCVAPKTPILSIALAPNQNQIVAFQERTQLGFCQATDRIAASGAYATTWGEVNFLHSGSGYDMSAIMNSRGNKYNMAISSKEASCISDMTQNYWLTDTQPIGTSDGSCFIAQSTATLTVHMGGDV